MENALSIGEELHRLLKEFVTCYNVYSSVPLNKWSMINFIYKSLPLVTFHNNEMPSKRTKCSNMLTVQLLSLDPNDRTNINHFKETTPFISLEQIYYGFALAIIAYTSAKIFTSLRE
jgi:hypothetical protein